MKDSEVFEVSRIEHHHLPSCPCKACGAERRRRKLPSPLMSIPPDVAFALGIISSLNPHGSVARQLMQKRN